MGLNYIKFFPPMELFTLAYQPFSSLGDLILLLTDHFFK